MQVFYSDDAFNKIWIKFLIFGFGYDFRVEGTDTGIKPNSQKLIDAGFRYACDMRQILEDSVKCMKRFEGLKELP